MGEKAAVYKINTVGLSRMENHERNYKDGWISLYRSILAHEFWMENKNPRTKFEAWIFLLLKSSHQKRHSLFQGEVREYTPGEFPTTILYLSKEFKWSRWKVRKFLKDLEDTEMIKLDVKDKKYTIIKIEKWQLYQNRR